MNRHIVKYLKSYSYKEKDINKLLVTSFLIINGVKSVKNDFINDFLIQNESDEVNKFLTLFDGKFDIEFLLELFEFVISPEDKEVNGAVFTPVFIRDFIVKQLFLDFENSEKDINLLKFGDIACGCGGFFKTITQEYREKFGKSYFEIYRDNLFGLDIQNYSIIRTKIFLILYAILNGEDKKEFEFNLFVGNALSFNWSEVSKLKTNNGFDAIVGNPPYVGSSNLDSETKNLMKNWSVSSVGKLDLYIPFFEISLKWLNNNGILGYITVNNFYRSLNGRALRCFFSKNSFKFKLIDFGSEQVFKSRLTYTCICQISKANGILSYSNSTPSNINSLLEDDFINFEYEELNDFDGWQLEDAKTQLNLNKLEKSGKKLGDLFSIRNGFATLRNKIYLFTPIKEDDMFYFFERDSLVHKVEKGICRDAIKPNILKDESDVNKYMEKIIFPYIISDEQSNILFQSHSSRTIRVLTEKSFQKQFPSAFTYLSLYKTELAKRDKGQRNYENWYSFGRSQALNIIGFKLLFPYISDKPYFIYTDDKTLLFYNGYAVVSDSPDDLRFIQKVLKTDVFWYYVKCTSKPYASNYFSMAKNYIKNFSIPDFSDKERKKFMKLSSKNSINKFLLKKYNITDIEL